MIITTVTTACFQHKKERVTGTGISLALKKHMSMYRDPTQAFFRRVSQTTIRVILLYCRGYGT